VELDPALVQAQLLLVVCHNWHKILPPGGFVYRKKDRFLLHLETLLEFAVFVAIQALYLVSLAGFPSHSPQGPAHKTRKNLHSYELVCHNWGIDLP
jgi:hypothetical protein